MGPAIRGPRSQSGIARLVEPGVNPAIGLRTSNPDEAAVWFCSSGVRPRTADPPASHRRGLRSAPGTEFSSPETGAKMRALCRLRPNAETTLKAKSPRSRAMCGSREERFGALGLGGGVRSHMRTGLCPKFPAIREFYRENRHVRRLPLQSDRELADLSDGCGTIP
jgi:hypothetical protein